jgi:rubrerythrin
MRNEDRLRAANVAEISALVNKESVPSVNNPVEIATPTQIVDLPSRGLFYPKDHPWYGKESVEIRFMTAKDEDILVNKSYIQKGIVLDRLLSSVLIDKKVTLDNILICDKGALIVATRITGYGTEYITDVTCPSCQKINTKYVFDLDLFTNDFPDSEKLESAQVGLTEDNTFVLELPKTKFRVEFKLLNGYDEKRLESLAETKKKQNLPDSTLTDQMKQYIVSINEETEKSIINKYIETMPAFDAKYLRKMYNIISPSVRNKQEFTCNHCATSQEVEVPLTTSFFWPE